MRRFVGGLLVVGAISVGVACSAAAAPDAPAKPPAFRSLGYDDQRAYYYDASSVIRAGNIVTVETVSIFNPDGGIKDGIVRSELTVDLDCAKMVASIAKGADFGQSNRLVRSYRVRTPWEPLPANGAGGVLQATLCANPPGERPKIHDIQADADLIFRVLLSRTPPQVRNIERMPEYATYFDAATIQRTGDITRAKVITVYNPSVSSTEGGTAVSEVTEDFDCARNRGSFVAAVQYDAAGMIISEGVFPETEWFEFTMGSLGHAFKEAVCSPEINKYPRVQDYRADAAEAFRRAK